MAKTDGKPLGKSFIRQTPINVREKIQGGEILDWDPRGRDASVGDGVKPPEFLPNGDVVAEGGESAVVEDETEIKSNGNSEKENQQVASVDPNSALDQRKASISSTTTSSSIVPTDSTSNRERHSSIASSTSNYSSSQNGSGSNTSSSIHAIKFAPLPTSGRLKRANSITIGVAARSQLLHSQGTGRSWQSQQRQQVHPMQPSSPSYPTAPKSRTASTSSNNSSSGLKDKRPIVNTEEELKKGASSIWRRMRSTSSSSSKSSTSNSTPNSSNDSTPSTPNTEVNPLSTSPTSMDEEKGLAHPVPDESGHATPKRPSSPHHHQTSQDGHHPSNLSHQYPHVEETEEGARTPKIQPHHPPLTRRVSTGAYLRDQSIRGMQDERRKEFIGDVDEFRNLDPHNHGGHHHHQQEEVLGFDDQPAGSEASSKENGNGNEGVQDKGLIANWMASLAGTGAQTEARKTEVGNGSNSIFGGISNPFASGNSNQDGKENHQVSVVEPPSPSENKDQFHEVEE